MHVQNEYEQAKYLARKRQNMFEKHYNPSHSKSKPKHLRFEDPVPEKVESRDICGMLELIKGTRHHTTQKLLPRRPSRVLTRGSLANAAYIFPTAITESCKIYGTSNAKEDIDVVVSKGDGRYRALLFVRGDDVPGLVGAYEGAVDAALGSLLDVMCEKAGAELMAKSKIAQL